MKFFNVALLLFAGAEAIKLGAFDAAGTAGTAATDRTADTAGTGGETQGTDGACAGGTCPLMDGDGSASADCPDCQVDESE